MKPMAPLMVLVMVSVLSACGRSEPPPEPREEHKALQRAIQQPLDKARGVEDELQKQQEAMNKQLEDAGG